MTSSYNKLAEMLSNVLPQVVTPQSTSQGAVKRVPAPTSNNQPIASTSTTNTYGSVDVETMSHNSILSVEMSKNTGSKGISIHRSMCLSSICWNKRIMRNASIPIVLLGTIKKLEDTWRELKKIPPAENLSSKERSESYWGK